MNILELSSLSVGINSLHFHSLRQSETWIWDSLSGGPFDGRPRSAGGKASIKEVNISPGAGFDVPLGVDQWWPGRRMPAGRVGGGSPAGSPAGDPGPAPNVTRDPGARRRALGKRSRRGTSVPRKINECLDCVSSVLPLASGEQLNSSKVFHLASI